MARSSGGSWPRAGRCARSPAATRRRRTVAERGAEPVRGDLDDVAVDGARAPPAARSPSTAPPISATGARARTSSAATCRARATRWPPPARPACGASSTSAPRPRCSPASRWSRSTSARRCASTRRRSTRRPRRAPRRRSSRPTSNGLETVVVRPRFVWGRGDTTLLPVMTEMVRAGRFAWIGGGRHRTSTTHVDNVVDGLRARRRARRARRRLLRHRRRARRLPRLRHPPARHAGRRRRPAGRCPAPVARAVAAAGETAWRLLPLPGRPPLTRLAVWLSALETHHRHHTRTHRARLRAGQDHRRGIGGAEAAMRIAVGSDHAGFHLKEHVKAGAGRAGPRRRRRGHRVVARGRLPALRRRGGAPGRRRRRRPRRPRLRLGRRRGDRRQQGRGRARRQRPRPVRGRDVAPPQRRQHRDPVGRAPGPERGRRDRAAPSCARSSRAAATPAAWARSRELEREPSTPSASPPRAAARPVGARATFGAVATGA